MRDQTKLHCSGAIGNGANDDTFLKTWIPWCLFIVLSWCP